MRRCAFDWSIYDDRRTALQHLKNNLTLVDTVIETEDGQAHEPVHSQVISAFGDKLTEYVRDNGVPLVESSNQQSHYHYVWSNLKTVSQQNSPNINPKTYALKPIQASPFLGNLIGHKADKLQLVRLPKVNRYTLTILVECAYSGYIRTDLASGGIWQVLEMADYYEMSDVLKACCSFLIKNLNQSNCIHFYHIAQNLKQNIVTMTPSSENTKRNMESCDLALMATRDLSTISIDNDQMPTTSMGLQQTQHETQSTTLSLQSPSSISSSLPPITLPSSSSSSSTAAAANDLPSVQPKRDHTIVAAHLKANNLATIEFEHFEPLLLHDKLNIDDEASIWYAIKLWCNYNIGERSALVANLLPCIRFPRIRTGTEFSAFQIWRDPLIMNNKRAQHQLAVLDRNHRDFLSSSSQSKFCRDGFNLPCAAYPRQLRPRIPHSILLAIGGWQQGQPTTLIETYDINCNMWFTCKYRIRSPLAYHGVEYINAQLYICGGTDGNDILSDLFTFDPISGDCHSKPPMRDARCYVSTAYLGNYLYALGGHNGAQRMRSVERFELKDEIWSHVQEMNVARSDASACVHENHIYIAGGLNDQVIESSVEFYNCNDNSWTFINSMLIPRTSFTLLSYNESLLAVGGNNGSERLNSVEKYDFITKTWSQQYRQMRYKRSTFSAALVDESKLIVVGGYNGQAPFSQVEMFDGRSWVTLQKIRYDRSGLKVVVVKDLPNASEYTFMGSKEAIGTRYSTNATDS